MYLEYIFLYINNEIQQNRNSEVNRPVYNVIIQYFMLY